MISTNASLHIENVNEVDGGEYICNAKNDFGIANIMFDLNILSKFLHVKIVDTFL